MITNKKNHFQKKIKIDLKVNQKNINNKIK